ncbi:MAG TPA: DUF4870 domain-containing protein [Planctomycetaceae bacterium]|nr:DUF4870 domain-containing protein [Planctomycetaceae bacterium]
MSEVPPANPLNDERLWAMLCHLSSFLTIFAGANVIAPLVIWMIKRDTSPLVADQGKEVLNFQITMIILYAVMIACFISVILFPLGIILAVLLPLWHLVLTIIGAIKAYDGQHYRYPLNIRLI